MPLQSTDLAELSGNVRIVGLRNAVLSPHLPIAGEALRGARLLADAPSPARVELAVVRAIARSNPRLDPFEALHLATIEFIRAQGEAVELASYDNRLIGAAGTLGIALARYSASHYSWPRSVGGG